MLGASQPVTERLVLPRFVTDPIWSLQPWPVVLELGERTLEIPALPASQWLAVLMVGELELEDIVPGLLCEEDADEVEEALYTGLLTLEQLNMLALDVVSQVSGRPWWVALRLVELARLHWDNLATEMTRADASRLSLSGWLDVLFVALLRAMEEGRRQMFLLKLEQPPKALDKAVPEDPGMSAAEFLAMARSG